MPKNRKHKLDTVGTGLLAGLALPLVIFLMVYLVRQPGISFSEYLTGLWRIHALIKIGSLCVFANLAVFWGFLRIKYERAARGVLGATLLYAFVVLISKAA
ncbi:hypothetical protein [Maribellus sp. YY47]|uniref:hypothetical protein n=1 Tax=Maribellus sp. YY47 TaxID=2929486 RepID=UPI00200188B4|nr:hypothetical protein [Maribellus sp. YY47]MCK3684546.1 hypothetical protein [Maribellus sp. YY47]